MALALIACSNVIITHPFFPHLASSLLSAATHGKRAIDNLGSLKPHIRPENMDDEVEAFEKTILAHADAFNTQQKKRAASFSSLASASTQRSSGSRASSVESSRRSSMHEQGFSNGFSFSKIGEEPEELSEDVQSAIDDAWEAEEDAVDMSVRILVSLAHRFSLVCVVSLIRASLCFCFHSPVSAA